MQRPEMKWIFLDAIHTENTCLSVLGQLELHRTSNLLHGLGLGGRADTGHGETDVDGGSDT